MRSLPDFSVAAECRGRVALTVPVDNNKDASVKIVVDFISRLLVWLILCFNVHSDPTEVASVTPDLPQILSPIPGDNHLYRVHNHLYRVDNHLYPVNNHHDAKFGGFGCKDTQNIPIIGRLCAKMCFLSSNISKISLTAPL